MNCRSMDDNEAARDEATTLRNSENTSFKKEKKVRIAWIGGCLAALSRSRNLHLSSPFHCDPASSFAA